MANEWNGKPNIRSLPWSRDDLADGIERLWFTINHRAGKPSGPFSLPPVFANDSTTLPSTIDGPSALYIPPTGRKSKLRDM